MRTLWVGKMRLKEYSLPRGPDLTVPLPEWLPQCVHWQFQPSRQWKLNQTVRNPGKKYFYIMFPSCWEMISEPPGHKCPHALEQWQGWPVAPICHLCDCLQPAGRQAVMEEESAFKDNPCQSVHHQAGWDIKSPWMHFSDWKLSLGYFPRKLYSS